MGGTVIELSAVKHEKGESERQNLAVTLGIQQMLRINAKEEIANLLFADEANTFNMKPTEFLDAFYGLDQKAVVRLEQANERLFAERASGTSPICDDKKKIFSIYR